MNKFGTEIKTVKTDEWDHASHGSHGSHASHANDASNNHANSVTAPTFTTNTHTATIGGVDWSGEVSSDTKIGNYGSTGSLTALMGVVNKVRNEMTSHSGTPSSESAPTQGPINASAISQLLKRSGGTLPKRYQAVTSGINTESVNRFDSSFTGHQNTSGTSTLTAAGTEINSHSNSTDNTTPAVDEKITTGGEIGCSYHHNTGTHPGYSTPLVPTTNTPDSTSTIPSTLTKGKVITKQDFDNIVAALGSNTVKQWDGPAALSDDSWKLFGYNRSTRTHASHASHGSHASHSSCKREYKDNIKNFDLSALDILDKVNVVSFNYTQDAVLNGNGDDYNIQHVGFIANDTDELLSTKYHDRMDYILMG